MSIIELNAVSGVRQYLGDEALEFQEFFFRHVMILFNAQSDAAGLEQRRAAIFRCQEGD